MIDIIISLALSLVMFGLGLKLNINQLKFHFSKPKELILGLFVQIFITPLIAIIIIILLDLNNIYSIGLLLLAAVPGGTTSGIISYWSKGDVSLSVSLTSLGGIFIAFFSLPFILYNSYKYLPIEGISTTINSLDLMIKLFLVVILPILLALIFKKVFPNFKKKANALFDKYLILYYIVVIIMGILILTRDLELLLIDWKILTISCLILNISMFSIGYFFSRFFYINQIHSKTIAIESAFQNNNLAFAISLVVIGNDTAALPSIIYGVVMTVTGLIVVVFSRKSFFKGKSLLI
ncbi:hypothetical protein [Polaribacter sp. Z022]|uniref:bile acid:sodium symporter family protein n=1 Tax=Polaribacter sp. Z022 TaxID=2927125 RepID=UPI0020209611|nr:hypothetical protein [Polaribacter sp. Z022]MCL7753111.1 hypothetical protein [Polaribacter sp. Z022]